MLSEKYNPAETEKRWQDFWKTEGIYLYDKSSSKPVYSIDTPPPTVSGKLHIGHVYSYTQAEIIARYKRMKGFNVFYPFGFDDNGLPTERYVESQHAIKGSSMPRAEFNQLCIQTVAEVETRFRSLWTSLGFSADWSLGYSTIDPLCQRISQLSFLDLMEKNLVYYKNDPHMWCWESQTAIAQAELEAKELESSFNDVRFDLVGGGSIVIGTTRPELMPACVCIFVHPEDSRYTEFKGREAIVPIFGHTVPILFDEKADPEKGTGAVMCCTFGDKTDVEWYKKHQLPLRICISRDGKMNELAQEFQGFKIKAARRACIEKLTALGHLLQSKVIQHSVNVYERTGIEVEYLVTPQWFIEVTGHKKELLELGDQLNWNPDFMKQRYVHWVENLSWDWCISRQRFFGVPFPVWHCADCNHQIPADKKSLPVDPLKDHPPLDTCPQCGSKNLEGDKNVMDTWATSSVTPQINSLWGETEPRSNLIPMSMRPQAHDIIRTWAFYTMVKAFYHHQCLPWKDIMISGHVLYKKGQKISKSKENSVSGPEELIATYSADVVRYWTAGAKLGADCYFEEQEFKIASRLITKLFNASKFALIHIQNLQKSPSNQVSFELDQGILSLLNKVCASSDQALQKYEYSLALGQIETFFWDFCDNYMELIKHRIYNPDQHGPGAGESAQNTIYTCLYALLRLLAPFIPHITEEIYQSYFRQRETESSLHLCPYPEFQAALENEKAEETYRQARNFVSLVRRYKTESRISLNTDVTRIEYHKNDFPALAQARGDVERASRCSNLVADPASFSSDGKWVEQDNRKILVCP